MLKLIKLLFISIVVLLIIMTVSIVLYISRLDLNHFKSQIINHVYQQTGYKLKINGDIKIAYLPKLKLEVHQINLSNKHAAFIKIKYLSASIALIPLLQKKIDISEIKIVEPYIELTINKNQTTLNKKANIFKRKSSSIHKHIDKTKQKLNLEQFNFLTLQTINIEGGKLKLQKLNQLIELNKLNFIAKNINIEKEVTFKANSLIKINLPGNKVKTEINLNGLGKINFKEIKNNNLINIINLNVKLTSPVINYNEVHIENIIGEINLNQGIADVYIKKSNAYQGNISGKISLNSINDKLVAHLIFNNINIEKLLFNLNASKVISGKLTSDIKLETKLHMLNNKLEYLNGEITTDIADGSLQSIDVNALIKSVTQLITNQHSLKQLLTIGLNHSENKKLFNTNSTPFKILTAKTIIKQGVATTDNIKLITDLFIMNGKGIIYLKQQDINLGFNISMINSKSKISKTLSILGGYIPITIKGKISHPKLGLNIKFIIDKLNKNLFNKKNISNSIKEIKNNFQNLIRMF